MIIRRIARRILPWCRAFGWDPLTTLAGFCGLPAVVRDYRCFRKNLNTKEAAAWLLRFAMPCLLDRHDHSGMASGHYFHQDLWVARRIYARKPQRHMDVGSSITGLVAHLAVFREVEVLDIRPQPNIIKNIVFRQHDMMREHSEFHACCDSLSCLHVLEHLGLGRYGDSIDPEGYRHGFMALVRMLEPGGYLYLSVPVGTPQRVEFNGHRVFAPATICDLAKGTCLLTDFAWVDDAGDLHEDITGGHACIPDNINYGCGVFEFCRTDKAIST